MDAETLDALERAVAVQAERGHDEPLIRALIERERSGGERAKVVAWLKRQADDGVNAAQSTKTERMAHAIAGGVVALRSASDAIASGAHEEQQP